MSGFFALPVPVVDGVVPVPVPVLSCVPVPVVDEEPVPEPIVSVLEPVPEPVVPAPVPVPVPEGEDVEPEPDDGAIEPEPVPVPVVDGVVDDGVVVEEVSVGAGVVPDVGVVLSGLFAGSLPPHATPARTNAAQRT